MTGTPAIEPVPDAERSSWRSWFRPTVRVRLTLLYGAMFFLCGAVLIAVVYAVFVANLPNNAGFVRLRDSALPGTTLPSDVQQALVDAVEEQRQQATSSMLQMSLLALLVVGALAVWFGWLMGGRVLQPVQNITATARRVADRSLHERINLPGPPDEFKELADTFDAMLERLDRSFDGQRRFVSNASHELRTPIAVNRTLLEVALAHSELTPELRQMLTTLLMTNDRSEQLIDGLLTLARSESQPITRRQVDLSDVAANAVEQTAHEASEAGVTMDAVPYPAPTAGDPALLERLALNLVQNSIRHNQQDGWVTVRTGWSSVSGWIELLVANSGPVIYPSDVERLFEPFQRRQAGRAQAVDRDVRTDTLGVGLGLSIVRSIARTHGGDARAVARETGGLEIRVLLPAAPPALTRRS